MIISAVAFSDRGMQLGRMLRQKFSIEFSLSLCSKDGLTAWTEENYSCSEALIYIGAVETAVLAVSPYIRLEAFGATVIVLDELGKFIIPIFSGHRFEANELAAALADKLKGIPVITAVTDTQEMFAVDTWAKSIGLRIANPHAAKYISSKLTSGEVVHFDSVFMISGNAPKGIEPAGVADDSDFSITYLSSVPEKVLHLVPPVLTLGIECKKEISSECFETAYKQFLSECGCHPLAVVDVCTIDLEAQEPGLISFCNNNGLPLRVFTPLELSTAKGYFTPSESANNDFGVDNVCERSAVLGSGGTLFVRKMDFDGITMAIAIKEPHIS